MTEDKLIERALRAEGVFPPSVMDCHYADKAEMTKGEIIVNTLEEMGILPLSEQDPDSARRLGSSILSSPSFRAGFPMAKSRPAVRSGTSAWAAANDATPTPCTG